ncbi:MAG: insulinase family protein [Prevotella sp.]|nr:insulinase family protein [Prevotella sp.]
MRKLEMKSLRRMLAVALAWGMACLAWAQTAKPLEVREMKLGNGMTVWLNEDHSQPKVFGAVVVNAGAKDCPNTGIAHYFEHIMFKGTDEIGTVNYAQEKPWLDSIAAAYDRLSATKDEAQRRAIQKDINRLSQKAGEYAIPNEFNSLISRYGGSGLNAGTSYDFTFYYNMFTPQYMEHWCQLNSDRLINPVFRMFQGELETVYEEKNRASDDMTTSLRETVFKELFGTQPYAYPVIGSTENLKNPKLSDMKRFYEQYYVGSNMGLILCGDFQADDVMPLLERTFGRIPQGVKPTRQKSAMPDILQERTVEVKLPVPLVSMEMLAFKGVTDFEPDANALALATQMLSNGNAGMLDSLMNEGVLMAGVITPASLNDAGALLLIVVPNLLSKTQKAEDACMEQLRRVANGDFSDKAFESQKQKAYREAFRDLETIGKRAQTMVEVMSSGHTWQQYIDKINAIEKLTKADVVAAAKRYVNAPFIRFKKKYGNTDKDKMKQPDYTPVKPKNKNAESEYAKRLAQLPVRDVEPRLIDFDNDATTIPLGGQATLYTVKNPVNDLFELEVIYNRGEKADPRLAASAALLNAIGTDSLTRQQLGAALEVYGADMTFESSSSSVTMNVTGVDKNFDAVMQIVGNFLRHMKSDTKALKKVKDALKAEEKTLAEENSDVLKAMMQKVMYGDKSTMLNRLTYKEVKPMTGEEMLEAFKAAQGSTCTITYSGTLDSRKVENVVRAAIPVERSTAAFVDYSDDVVNYSSPLVFVYDMPKARQTLFSTYEQLRPLPSKQARIPAALLEQYFGGGMSSVLFQEVREFRSMAYSVGSSLRTRSSKRNPNSPVGFVSVVGTQGDKAMSAIALVDSLLKDMPLIEKNFESVRQELINDISNDFPSFRTIGTTIASSRLYGWTEDVNTGRAAMYRNATMDDMRKYYEENIKNHSNNRVIAIVGSKKKLNLKELEKYGKVVLLKEKDLFKK